MYILVTKSAKILLTSDQKKQFELAFENSKSQLLTIKGQSITRFSVDGVYDLEFFIKQEADLLKQKGQRRCRKCGEILARSDICACRDQPELLKNNIFIIENKNLLDQPKK